MLDDEPITLDAKYQLVIKQWWCGRNGAEDGEFNLPDGSQSCGGASRVRLVLGFVIRIFINGLSKTGISIHS